MALESEIVLQNDEALVLHLPHCSSKTTSGSYYQSSTDKCLFISKLFFFCGLLADWFIYHHTQNITQAVVVMRYSDKLKDSIGLMALLLVQKGKSCKIILKRRRIVLFELVFYHHLERCQRWSQVQVDFILGKRMGNGMWEQDRPLVFCCKCIFLYIVQTSSQAVSLDFCSWRG